ncbi:hypothetical protein SAMN05216313_1729 [Enterocloster lavalensis]|uniref:Uncharacterized protein n=2 Tax=Enterocloster lavalensis TaxID=460384 RepID=A0A1I0KFV2_9FIRM|nr:hypothetical protein SAMN05216313_1729 [Enterocloster lavalensis]
MLVWNITIKETKPMKINRWKQSYKNLKLAQKMLLIYLVLLGVCLVLCLTALRVSFNIYDNKVQFTRDYTG